MLGMGSSGGGGDGGGRLNEGDEFRRSRWGHGVGLGGGDVEGEEVGGCGCGGGFWVGMLRMGSSGGGIGGWGVEGEEGLRVEGAAGVPVPEAGMCGGGENRFLVGAIANDTESRVMRACLMGGGGESEN